MRYRVDGSWTRYERVVLAGSPLRIFRTTEAGAAVLDRLEAGDAVEPSRLVERLLDGGAIHPVAPLTSSPRSTVDDLTFVTPQLGALSRDIPHGAGPIHTDGRLTIDDGSVPALDGAAARLDVNRGPAAARNAARPLVSTSLVVFLDADVSTTDGRAHAAWAESLLWHFDDPRVALVAPRVRGEDGSPLDLGDTEARIRAGTRVSFVPGAALIVRVAALDAIGWFDEGLRFGEDVDLVWRLDQAGWRCRYDPSVSVWHAPRHTWRERLAQHAGYGTSAAPLALRHPTALSPVSVNGWTLGAWATSAAGLPGPGGLLALASAAALERKLPDVPRRDAFLLAMRGHALAGRQFASAIRRAWWPILAVAALVSRRARWVAIAAFVADLRAAPTDAAYGWGLWSGMRRHRTLAPIIPHLTSWPPRRRPSRKLHRISR